MFIILLIFRFSGVWFTTPRCPPLACRFWTELGTPCANMSWIFVHCMLWSTQVDLCTLHVMKHAGGSLYTACYEARRWIFVHCMLWSTQVDLCTLHVMKHAGGSLYTACYEARRWIFVHCMLWSTQVDLCTLHVMKHAGGSLHTACYEARRRIFVHCMLWSTQADLYTGNSSWIQVNKRRKWHWLLWQVTRPKSCDQPANSQQQPRPWQRQTGHS